jgi:two-component system chemotaxis sensor kinase CheA
MAVEIVLDEHQTAIQFLATMYTDGKGVSGATILGNGTIVRIFDKPLVASCD